MLEPSFVLQDDDIIKRNCRARTCLFICRELNQRIPGFVGKRLVDALQGITHWSMMHDDLIHPPTDIFPYLLSSFMYPWRLLSFFDFDFVLVFLLLSILTCWSLEFLYPYVYVCTYPLCIFYYPLPMYRRRSRSWTNVDLTRGPDFIGTKLPGGFPAICACYPYLSRSEIVKMEEVLDDVARTSQDEQFS